jgi:hypothetical protein
MSSRLRELIRNGVPDGLLHYYCCPQGKGGSPPAAPDYKGAAETQSAASENIATQKTFADRPDQYSPWGSTTWNTAQSVDPATGKPVTSWTQQQTLNPELQSALDQQIGLVNQRSNLAGNFMGRVAEDYQQPFNWKDLPGMSQGPNATGTGTYQTQSYIPQTTGTTNAPAFADQRQQYTQAMWDAMQPEHQRQTNDTRAMLANQGLTPGSEAYNTELRRLEGNQGLERWNAIQAGGQEQQRMNQQMLAQQQQAFGQGATAGQFYNQAGQQQFGQEMGANQQNFNQQLQQSNYQNQLRQQAIAEQAQARGMSLNEMNALLTGQMVQPNQMPSFNQASAGTAPNYLGAAQMQGQSDMQRYLADQQANAGLWGGIGQAAGAGASLYALGVFSDVRLKSNIEHVGMHPVGVPIYDYDIFGRRERGVMAQDLLHVRPDLVLMHPSGYLMVNYGGLNGIQ